MQLRKILLFRKSEVNQQFIANAYINLVLNQLYDILGFERIELGGIKCGDYAGYKYSVSIDLYHEVQLQIIQGQISHRFFL